MGAPKLITKSTSRDEISFEFSIQFIFLLSIYIHVHKQMPRTCGRRMLKAYFSNVHNRNSKDPFMSRRRAPIIIILQVPSKFVLLNLSTIRSINRARHLRAQREKSRVVWVGNIFCMLQMTQHTQLLYMILNKISKSYGKIFRWCLLIFTKNCIWLVGGGVGKRNPIQLYKSKQYRLSSVEIHLCSLSQPTISTNLILLSHLNPHYAHYVRQSQYIISKKYKRKFLALKCL